MKYLLDTQVLIYLGCGHTERIGKKALRAYHDLESEIYISQISYWEMAIKINIGKLTIPIGLQNVMILARDAGISLLPMENEHILRYQTLPRQEQHRDPFDRYILAVALCAKMSILSDDEKFDLYKEAKRVWD